MSGQTARISCRSGIAWLTSQTVSSVAVVAAGPATVFLRRRS